jgi:hypothetical protein
VLATLARSRQKWEALARKRWIAGELASGRVPELRLLAAKAPKAPTLAEAAEAWRASRVDVTEGTRTLHRVALARVLPILGTRCVDKLEPDDFVDLIAALTAAGYKRETIKNPATTSRWWSTTTASIRTRPRTSG